MNSRGMLAHTLAESLDWPHPRLMPLTWNERRFPLPKQPGLAASVLLEENRPGVYIIEKMTASRSNYTVRVGSVTTGTVYDRLRNHGRDWKITHHGGNGLVTGLRAFWTLTGSLNTEGVEKYLADLLHPAEGYRYPKSVDSVGVVLPQPIRDRILGIVRPPRTLADLDAYQHAIR